MLLPVVVYFLVFRYAPMYGITIAFKDYNIFKGIFDSPWIGFKVFEKVLQIRISGLPLKIHLS